MQVVMGDFKGICETSNDKNVSSEDTCFGIRSEITVVSSKVLSCLGTVIVSKNTVLNEKNPRGKENRETEPKRAHLYFN